MQRLGDPTDPAAVRFQQTSGMVMAKGVEDTAFYRYSRLVSLNEVGGEPNVFSFTADEFHARQQRRLATFRPRDDDPVDARHEARQPTSAPASRCSPRSPTSGPRRSSGCANSPPSATDRSRTSSGRRIVGVWPASRERLHAYAEKASREAEHCRRTWTAPDEAFEKRMHALVDACFDDDRGRE